MFELCDIFPLLFSLVVNYYLVYLIFCVSTGNSLPYPLPETLISIQLVSNMSVSLIF